jgi:hypothetical protein
MSNFIDNLSENAEKPSKHLNNSLRKYGDVLQALKHSLRKCGDVLQAFKHSLRKYGEALQVFKHPLVVGCRRTILFDLVIDYFVRTV